MKVVETIQDVRQQVARARERSPRPVVGLVPTMGALHEGHLSLVEAARKECGYVVVSIFVNPTQFGPNEDYTEYPRPIASDLAMCEAAGVDLVFHPSTAEIYGQGSLTAIHVDRLTADLCGRSRLVHFDGVALVVTKLFNIVQPDRAYFGQKDGQQALVIKRLAQDLNLPLEVVVCPTVRESDGLAVSSRNAYLTDDQRKQASVLFRSLQAMRDCVKSGERDVAVIVGGACELIENSGPCRIDYVELVDAETLEPAETVAGRMLAAVAVRIGDCRLIDNLVIDVKREK